MVAGRQAAASLRDEMDLARRVRQSSQLCFRKYRIKNRLFVWQYSRSAGPDRCAAVRGRLVVQGADYGAGLDRCSVLCRRGYRRRLERNAAR
ncbi:hypothetical protein D3C84_1176660 [compost metagenome]